MIPAEKKVVESLEESGFNWVSIEPGLFLLNKGDNYEEKSLYSALSEEIGIASFYRGASDLLAYTVRKNGEHDYEVLETFFVEVKSRNDSLMPSQIHWMSKQEVDTFIAVVNDEVNFYKTDFEAILSDEI